MQHDNLELLRALEADEWAARRRALWTSSALMVVAALVLAALLFSAYRQLSSVRAETRRETARLDTLRRQIDSLRPVVENYVASLAVQQSRATSGDSLQRPVDSVQAAAHGPDEQRVPLGGDVQAMAAPPPVVGDSPEGGVSPERVRRAAARRQPRVYLQVLSAEDRPYAEQMRERLRGLGFDVPGVEHVRRPVQLRNTEVRYYKRTDAEEARTLEAALRRFGEESTALIYLRLDNDARVRARTFEVWFPAGAGGARARAAQ